MVNVVCMDGLGGNPEITFRELKIALEAVGFSVHLLDPKGIKTHEDRVRRVIGKVEELRHADPQAELVLIGQSAGGSAVRIAAERLRHVHHPVAGVVMLSPAMPRGIFFTTRTLFKLMVKHTLSLCFGIGTGEAGEIVLKRADHAKLLSPISDTDGHEAVATAPGLPWRECRTLAFDPQPLGKLDGVSVLLVYGNLDRWVSSSAHRKLECKLKSAGVLLQSVQCAGAGHLTLKSAAGPALIEKIIDWVKEVVRAE